jgi:hypothetical protein
VRDGEETLADEAKLVWKEVVGITARDDDILDDWIGGNVGECLFPAGFDRFVGCLGYGFGVATNGVGACAVAAIEATDGCCWVR